LRMPSLTCVSGQIVPSSSPLLTNPPRPHQILQHRQSLQCNGDPRVILDERLFDGI
jgi:hypothetical protein